MGAYLWIRGDEPMPHFFIRRRRPIPRWKRRLIMWITISFLLVLLAYTVLRIVERNVEPVLKTFAETRVKQVATDAVREALKEQILLQEDFEDVIQFVKDGNGDAQVYVIDHYKQTKLYEDAVTQIQNYLKHDMYHRMQEQDLDKMEIYLGQAFKSRIFADAGPSIPVTLIPKGSVEVDLNPKMQSAGINNVLVSFILNIKVEVSIIIPFPTDPITVQTRYPIASVMVVGDTPQWYWNTSGSTGEMPVVPGITPEGAPDGTKN